MEKHILILEKANAGTPNEYWTVTCDTIPEIAGTYGHLTDLSQLGYFLDHVLNNKNSKAA